MDLWHRQLAKHLQESVQGKRDRKAGKSEKKRDRKKAGQKKAGQTE
jgi:hypothetical protein